MTDPTAPDHFLSVYQDRAALYEELVVLEDAPGHLLPALRALHPAPRPRIVEFGAGTGRLTRLLAPLAREIRAFDGAPAMVREGRTALAPWPHVTLEVADNARLPVPDAWADLAVEGWSFGHAVGWFPDTWRTVVRTYLDEMDRVLAPGGTAVLLETLGTGSPEPLAPNPGLAELYAFLEGEGYAPSWIRTDYRFPTLARARELTAFFFRHDFAFEARDGAFVLPECTGLWSRRRP
jgi:SAM-dependent methyltransferase